MHSKGNFSSNSQRKKKRGHGEDKIIRHLCDYGPDIIAFKVYR